MWLSNQASHFENVPCFVGFTHCKTKVNAWLVIIIINLNIYICEGGEGSYTLLLKRWKIIVSFKHHKKWDEIIMIIITCRTLGKKGEGFLCHVFKLKIRRFVCLLFPRKDNHKYKVLLKHFRKFLWMVYIIHNP
jgi:hypothetical protein